MEKKVDRTYRTNPQGYGENLTRRIVADSRDKMDEWERKGRLPLFIRIKNKFGGRNKVELRGDR
ncbi:MAG: hypothetical protein ACRDNS_17810 [Trebonia sp.]